MATNIPNSDPCPASGRWRWRRRLLVLLVLLGCLYLARSLLLRNFSAILILEECEASAPFLVLLEGDGRHARAAQWHRSGSDRQILLIGQYPQRLEVLGLIPSRFEMDRRALRAEGVVDAAILFLPGQARDDWQKIRLLQGWLRDHAGAEVHLLCQRFHSRRLHLICQRVLDAEAGRVHLLMVPARDYDESCWWQRKEGLLDFLGSSLSLTYCWMAGERTAPWHDWQSDDYQAGLP